DRVGLRAVRRAAGGRWCAVRRQAGDHRGRRPGAVGAGPVGGHIDLTGRGRAGGAGRQLAGGDELAVLAAAGAVVALGRTAARQTAPPAAGWVPLSLAGAVTARRPW